MASDKTESRRERVKELFGKSDLRIAKVLIDEGHFNFTVKRQWTKARTEEEEAKFVDACRRTVNNDRRAIREQWAKTKRTTRDITISTEEYITRLRTRIEDLETISESASTRPTAKVNALAEIRQLETLIAKASGVDAEGKRGAPDDPDEPGSGTRFVGLLLDLSETSGEVQQQLLNERPSKKRK